MTAITHAKVEVTKNNQMKVTAEVPMWEANVLVGLWGDDAQIVETLVRDRELPDANNEFTRLAQKYGPRDEDIPIVARVYGSFGPGLRALEREFQDSIVSLAKDADVELKADEELTDTVDTTVPSKSPDYDASNLLPPGVSLDDLVDDDDDVVAA